MILLVLLVSTHRIATTKGSADRVRALNEITHSPKATYVYIVYIMY